MFLDLVHGCFVDQWANFGVCLQTVADFQICHGLCQFFDECVVDTVIGIDAVGTDAGLTGIAELRKNCAFDWRIDICVFKDDEWCIATKFESQFLDLVRGLPHQDAAYFRRACKAQFPNLLILAELGADCRTGGGGQHRKYTGRYTGTFSKNLQSQCRTGCLFCRLGDEGAPCRECRCCLSGDHCDREIPRGYRTNHTGRLFDDHDAFVVGMAGDHVAISPFASSANHST